MPVRISMGQLFALLNMFMLGSTWLFGLGAKAGPDAWLATLLGAVLGLFLLLGNLRLQQLHPGKSLVQYLPLVAGRFVGWVLAFCYILYFLYLAARVTRDFAELTIITLLPGTPLSAVALVMVLLVCYAVKQGQEVLARCAEALLPLVMAILLFTFLLLVPEVQLANLRPVLGGGFGKVWQAAFPVTVTVPFGEAVVFGMVWPATESQRNVATLWAVAVTGLTLTWLSAMETAILGDHLVATSHFPLLEMVRQVTASEFLDRIDAVAVLMMTLGGFMKIAVFTYAAVLGVSQWVGLKDHRPLVLPMGSIIAALSLAIAQNYPEHIQIGLQLVPVVMHIPLQILLPFLLLVLAELRRWATGRGDSPERSQGDGTW